MVHHLLLIKAPLLFLVACVAPAAAFTAASIRSTSIGQLDTMTAITDRRTVPRTGYSARNKATTGPQRQRQRHHMIPSTVADAVSSLLIATVDSDIANIPDNEFATVFAGGIVVMFGGLFSALFVGWMVDSRNLYASIVADSYAQASADGDDEEFWKGLSEEEKIKTKELLKRLKASGQQSGGGGSRDGMEALEVLASAESAPSDRVKATVPSPQSDSTTEVPSTAKKDTGMFSDY